LNRPLPFSLIEPTILLACGRDQGLSPDPNFLSMCRLFDSYSQPIRFARSDKKSVNSGLPVMDLARALDPCRRPEGKKFIIIAPGANSRIYIIMNE